MAAVIDVVQVVVTSLRLGNVPVRKAAAPQTVTFKLRTALPFTQLQPEQQIQPEQQLQVQREEDRADSSRSVLGESSGSSRVSPMPQQEEGCSAVSGVNRIKVSTSAKGSVSGDGVVGHPQSQGVERQWCWRWQFTYGTAEKRCGCRTGTPARHCAHLHCGREVH